MTIVGTRPELIKLSRVIAELDRHTDHIQNFDFELNEVFFQELGIRQLDIFLNASGATAAETIGKVIIAADEVFEREKPDAVLMRCKIPVFHMEAIAASIKECRKKSIAKSSIICQISICRWRSTRAAIFWTGLPPERVIKSGSTMTEVLSYYGPAMDRSEVLAPKSYIVVSLHREENVDEPLKLKRLFALPGAFGGSFRSRLIVSTHPRTRKRLEAFGDQEIDNRISFLKPCGFLCYVKLQMNAFCVVSDSGTIGEESSILGFRRSRSARLTSGPRGWTGAL
jgi:UDP-N-acetylglucosamine 2-epimerase (non-hydrolysing)